jgi:hypothetical protein
MMIFGGNFMTARIHQLRQLAYLEPPISQHLQKGIFLFTVFVFLMARVIQLGRALDTHLEAGFSEVSWRWRRHQFFPKKWTEQADISIVMNNTGLSDETNSTLSAFLF